MVNPEKKSLRKFLQLWAALFAFQLIRFAVFFALIRSHWMNDRMLMWALAAVVFDFYVTRWLIMRYAGLSSLSVTTPALKRAGLIPVGTLIYSFLLPLIVLLLCDSPWRILPDGPLYGPRPVSAVDGTIQRGVIKFTDGRALHEHGGSAESTGSRYSVVGYAEPYVGSQWKPGQAVRIWAVHTEYEEITSEHQYAYVVSWNYTARSFWNSVVADAVERHKLQSADDAILVKLDTRPPPYEHGPTLLQFIFAIYMLLGLCFGFSCHAFFRCQCPKS